MRFLMRSTFALLSIVVLLTVRVPAQQAAVDGGSTVIGHVNCADNNDPARFAKVLLRSTAPSHAAADRRKQFEDAYQQQLAPNGESAKPLTPEQRRMMAAMEAEQEKSLAQINQAEDRTKEMSTAVIAGLDGSFSITGVKPGTYYVHAVYSGYIDPVAELSEEDFASTDPTVRARIARIPTVTVNGADSARVDLRLDRGAAISGRILYDDGSPATGWTVSAIEPSSPEQGNSLTDTVVSMQLGIGGDEIPKTDDLGRYRIPALAPGEYAVRATYTAANFAAAQNDPEFDPEKIFGSAINLLVYSGDTFFRADAKSMKVTDGEELSGVDIIVPAGHLHSISGHVVSKADGHPVNSGMLSLTSKDKAMPSRTSSIGDDGSFRFECLPNGNTYVIRVLDAQDVKPAAPGKPRAFISPREDVLQDYGPAGTSIPLGEIDIEALSIEVPQMERTGPANGSAGTVATPANDPSGGGSGSR
jgi:hypothetical protein